MVHVVVLEQVIEDAALGPKLKVVAPGATLKPLPVTVTKLPPEATSVVGLTALTVTVT